MKLAHVFGLLVAVLCSTSVFAAKTDSEVVNLTAEEVQAAVIASTSIGKGCGIDFDEAKFSTSLNGNSVAVLISQGGSGSPEGDGNSNRFLEGAISVSAGEAYMTAEEFKNGKGGGAVKMVLGLNLTISRDSCKSNALHATLDIFRDKDNNVVSTTDFKIK